VDVEALEAVGVATLEETAAGAKLVIVDEIGKMELLSRRFREAVLRALGGGRPVLASIMLSRHPFADALKARDDVRLIHVTPEIRDRALNEAVAAVREMLR
jgi:nucleoside-triphosphatase THEP1